MQKDNLGDLLDKVFIEIGLEKIHLIESIKLITLIFIAFGSHVHFQNKYL
jgi:hypothetical protein